MNRNEDDLLFQLRRLRRERVPEADLWPGIAARILAQGHDDGDRNRQAPAPEGGNVVPLRRHGPARFAPWALAASLVLALGVVWQQRPETGAAPSDPTAGLIQREADAMTREYDAALRELQAAGAPAAADDALSQLDQSAAQIRTALARDPGARFLLDRLRDTYEKRLELTQRLPLT